MAAPHALHVLLRRKLTLFMLLPCIGFVVLAGLVFGLRDFNIRKQQDLLLAESLARLTEVYVLDARFALDHLAQRTDLSDPADLAQDLKRLHTAYPHFSRLVWLGPDDSVLAVYPPGRVEADLPLRLKEFSGPYDLLLSRPMTTQGGAPAVSIGVRTAGGTRAVGELSLLALQQHLNQFTPPEDGRRIVITDTTGTVIVHPDPQQVGKPSETRGGDPLKTLGRGDSASVLTRQGNTTWLTSVVRVDTLDWVLGLSTSASSVILPPLKWTAALTLALVAAFIVAGHLFRAELNREVAAPLAGFAALVKRTASGGVPVPPPGQSPGFAELASIEEEFTLMYREISRRENEQRASREYIRSTLDSLPSVFVAVDGDGAVTQWSAGAERLTQIPGEQAKGRPLAELMPEPPAAWDAVRRVLETGRSESLDHLTWATQDAARTFSLEAHPLKGVPQRGAVLRMDDITTRTRLETAMVQTEKMMSVGGLAAGMAHELNNPLGGMLQGAQNVIRRLDPGLSANAKAAAEAGLDPEAMRTYLDARRIPHMLSGMVDSGKRAADIVSKMLNFARAEAPEHTLSDLHALIEAAVGLASSDYDLKERYDFRNIEIVRDYAEGLPLVPCLGMEIEQVIFNLLKNAAQALSGAPDPNKPPRITLRTRQKHLCVHLQVADNGPGIPDEIRPRIFEPFFSTREVGRGTGLGLSVAYYIVTNNHGGAFAVDSLPGQGAVFTVILPLEPNRQGPACSLA